MPDGLFVAYYRVSTARQGRSGLGLEAQQEAVRQYLNGGHWKLVDSLMEVESGKRGDRPKLAEALRLCRLHGATLIIAKLDRLSRNVAFIAALMDSGVEFVAVDFPQANRLTVHILAAVAEHETKMVSERTVSALARASERRKREGKPTLGGDRGNILRIQADGAKASGQARKARALAKAKDVAPTILELQSSGASLKAIARELTRRGIPTPRKGGAAWSSMTVYRVLNRIEEAKVGA